MKEIVADVKLIAYCGLYCGACKSYLKGSCPGCHKNEKASWCKVRSCNLQNVYSSCVDCTICTYYSSCKKLNNPVSKLFALIFGSNRPGALAIIKDQGYERFAAQMTQTKRMTPEK